jgi:CheY-like chemotaxis protein
MSNTRADMAITIGREDAAASGDVLLILSVESQPRLRHCIRSMVAQALESTHILVSVSSAGDAIALLGNFRFDLVISAYRLGDAHGGQILDYLREERPKDLQRFVFFTGSEEARILHPKLIEKGVRVAQFVSELRRLTRDQLPWSPLAGPNTVENKPPNTTVDAP